MYNVASNADLIDLPTRSETIRRLVRQALKLN